MAYTIQNSEGRWEVGNVKLTDSHIAIEKDENGVITAPLGLVEQIANDALEEDKATQIAEATKYLSDTDWVIVKITEMQLEGVDTTSLMEKYKEELINRTFYRNLINSLEE